MACKNLALEDECCNFNTDLVAGDDDGSSLELAFSKKKVEQRKIWLKDFIPGTYLDHDAEEISYSDFVHRELILFSRADLDRSIPCMLDGLKPGQRKILFACFKRNLKNDVKVRVRCCYLTFSIWWMQGVPRVLLLCLCK